MAEIKKEVHESQQLNASQNQWVPIYVAIGLLTPNTDQRSSTVMFCTQYK